MTAANHGFGRDSQVPIAHHACEIPISLLTLAGSAFASGALRAC